MKKTSAGWSVTLIALVTVTGLSNAAECGLEEEFEQTNIKVKAGITPIWAHPQRLSVFFESSLNTNTDGTRRSYSIDDFWGKKTALNNLCNAMTDACSGLNDEPSLRKRRETTQKQAANGWPNVKITHISPHIIAFGKDGKPCPPIDGYLISATALHKRKHVACSPDAYIDALKVPALVVPGRPDKRIPTWFESNGVVPGDLVVAIGPRGDHVYGVVGDSGPSKKLGEASISMNGQLLGKTEEPKNYQQIRGREGGSGWEVSRASVLIFPNTRRAGDPYMTAPEIEAAAKDRFSAWGGPDRLKACIVEYRAKTDQAGQRAR
ncbi:glycoside hydrolase family 75 protein [Paraburkholderia sp. RL18-101-BIB-B]|uniref:hypothetical protein n=1 Tax=Paraburkholderia sp. RL18-101-BIB-B TaxID=3031634 RepID=UPI0038BB5862